MRRLIEKNNTYFRMYCLSGKALNTVFQNIFIAAACVMILSCSKGVDVNTSAISGRVELCGTNFNEGAEITLESVEFGTFKTNTDSNGDYAFSRLWDGTYTITIFKEGYTFYPDQRRITVKGGDVISQDFITSISWSKTYFEGGKTRIYEMIQTMDCGYAVVGYKDISNTGSEENPDIWVAKFDLYGKFEWEWTRGGVDIDIGYAIVETADFGYIVTGKKGMNDINLTSDLWLMKIFPGEDPVTHTPLSPEQEPAWEQTYGGTANDIGLTVLETNNGEITVGGYTESYQNLNDIWLMKLSGSTGEKAGSQYEKYYRDLDKETLTYIEELSGGGYIAGGYSEVRPGSGQLGEKNGFCMRMDEYFDTGENQAWYMDYRAFDNEAIPNEYNEINSIKRTIDGGFIAVGSTKAAFGDFEDLWVLKLASNGTKEWEKVLNSGMNESGKSVFQRDGGNFLIASEAWSLDTGTYDFWAVTLDSAGIVIGENWYNGAEGAENHAEAAIETTDGGYALGGWTSAGSREYVWILKFDKNGEIINK